MPEYEIIIRNETAKESAGAPVSGEEGAEHSVRPDIATDTGGDDPDASRAPQKKPKDKAPLISAKTITPFIMSALNFHVSTAQLRTGSAEYQQRLDFARKTAGEVISYGASVASGFAVGGVAGAAVAATVGALQKVMEISQSAERIRLEREIEAESLGELSRRAGMGLSKYRRG